MEEKYPIKFTLGQFILLLATQLVILALIFLLGARFGGNFFPSYSGQNLAQAKAGEKINKLVSVSDLEPSSKEEQRAAAQDPMEEGAATVSVYQIGANGERVEAGIDEAEEKASAPLPPSRPAWSENPIDKNTLIRFKSSGNSKFAIEVGRYHDELLASKQVTSLKGKGYEAYLAIDTSDPRFPFYLVRIGSFGDRIMADGFARRLSNEQNLELRVVQIN